jgi:hypothetical protein
MREVCHAQLPLAARSSHPRAEELVMMSRALDDNHSVLRAVHGDLLRVRDADAKQGRKGMSAEQVVRAAVVKRSSASATRSLRFS